MSDRKNHAAMSKVEAEPAKLPDLGRPLFRSVSIQDLSVAVGLPFLFALAWTVPMAAWPRLGRAFSSLASAFVSSGEAALIAEIERYTGRQAMARTPVDIRRELLSIYVERTLLYLRHYRPGAWSPAVTLEGAAHIETALGHGRGTVIWDSHFGFASLMTKIALHRAGHPVSHLSHPRHGFSATPFGRRRLNPIITNIETRYLRERVLLDEDQPAGSLQTLKKRLLENGVVSITVRGAARRPVTAPFLDGSLSLAAGAPYLACETGAALLPVFTHRDEQGAWRVTVEPPLTLPEGSERSAAIAAAVAQYAQRLEPHVRRYPGQWLGWVEK